MRPVSVCIIAYNEADKIARCLQSVSWANEIIVVDSGSSDNTIEICKQYTDKIYHRDWTGYVDQKNYAMSLAKYDWVLSVDADEEVSPELSQEIQRLFQSEVNNFVGYNIPRLTYYLGKWIKHSGWYPDEQLRLFQKNKAKWVGRELHERIQVDGSIGRLNNVIYHYTYRDISEHLATINHFATLWVEEQVTYGKGKKPSAGRLVLHPVIKFIECYFWKRGFLDGKHGLIIAGFSAYYIFLRNVKLFERHLELGVKETRMTE
ncbi:MAG: glycosyltransferase family 2 protein [bacterium]|nr:glycosyltransferase family 2 protein [bacterium]